MGLSLERLLARLGRPDIVLGGHPEAVGGEGLEAGHQEPGLIPAGVDLRDLLVPVLPDVDLVAGDGVVVVAEGDGPGEEDGPAADAGDHRPVRWRLWGVLDDQLHGTGVQPVVDEAVVDASVLYSDWAELQSVSPLVQGPPVGVVPLRDLVVVPQQSQAPAGVRGTGPTVTAAADPLYQVDVGAGGHSPARHRDVAPGPGHHAGRHRGS